MAIFVLVVYALFKENKRHSLRAMADYATKKTSIKKPYCKDTSEFDEESHKTSSAVRLSSLKLLNNKQA